MKRAACGLRRFYVWIYCHCADNLKGEAVRTTNIHALSKRLGISSKVCYRLITCEQWIAAERNGSRGQYHVTDSAIHQFVRGRRVRLLVRPMDIPDPGLRRIAVFAHLTDPGRWWSMALFAQHFHCGATQIRRWRSAGWLASQWQCYGKGYFWYGHTLPAPHIDPRLPKSEATLLRLGIAH